VTLDDEKVSSVMADAEETPTEIAKAAPAAQQSTFDFKDIFTPLPDFRGSHPEPAKLADPVIGR
jgi:hypothetical protein